MKIDLDKGGVSNEEFLIYPISIGGLRGLKGTDAITKEICRIRELKDFKAKNEELCCFFMDGGLGAKRVALIGLGEYGDANQEVLRRAMSVVIAKAQKLKITKISAVLPELEIAATEITSSLVEGVELSNYVYQKYITKEDRKTLPIKSLKIYCGSQGKPDQLKKAVSEAQALCKYANYSRDLVNENSNQKYSLKLAKNAKNVCAGNKLKVTELGEGELKKLNMNLVLAVNSGSDYPPRFLEINYTGDPKSKKRVALVGKGLTFDTGGLNLKPTKSIEDMKLDMSGAATVVSIINCAAELKLKVNITATVVLVENMIGPKSFKPGDIFDSYLKKTVEIRNTDAEGRLVLADALAYTIEKYKPELVIDFATLTGACLVALGEYYAGAMSNDQQFMDQMLKSSERTSECIWQLPLYDDLAKSLKSDIADLQNSGPSRFGGTIFGGLFLKEFVGKTPWIHIDFAGPAFFEKNHYYIKKGGSGFGVRLIIDFLKNVKL